MVDLADIRAATEGLPRSYEVLVRDRIKFRVGQLVYLAVAPDELSMGIAFPKEERDAAIAAEPDKFFRPIPSDERFRWIQVRLDAIDPTELRELVLEAWRMCVPKKVAAEYFATRDRGPHEAPAGGNRADMATEKQRAAARKNVRKAVKAAKSEKTIANMPKKTRTALGKQGAAVAQRKRTGGSEPKTRAELYREAQRRELPGRSKMGRDELERALRRG